MISFSNYADPDTGYSGHNVSGGITYIYDKSTGKIRVFNDFSNGGSADCELGYISVKALYY